MAAPGYAQVTSWLSPPLPLQRAQGAGDESPAPQAAATARSVFAPSVCAGAACSATLLRAAVKPELKKSRLARVTLNALEIQILVPVSGAEVPGGRPLTVGHVHYGELALGQGSREQTPLGNSLNPISSSYHPINAGPLPLTALLLEMPLFRQKAAPML